MRHRMVHVTLISLSQSSAVDFQKTITTKLDGKPSPKQGHLFLHHPSNMPNQFFLGKSILVLTDKSQSNLYEVRLAILGVLPWPLWRS